MLYDKAKVQVSGGDGGNGAISFRREAHVPRGGPDGGDGGRGGDVVLVCDSSRRDLSEMRFSMHFKAGRGGHGSGQKRHGGRGEDRHVRVPPGTQVAGLEGDRFDLLEPGQRVVVARGGSGGHGNRRFAGPTRQAPRFAEFGLEADQGWIELRLKLLADCGFVGLPNAGKSSLLRRLTRANPKVGDYPFTTLEPVLGTIETDDRQIVLADIPGLIEGAAEGAGLGHEFLAHVERCRVLVHLIELPAAAGSSEEAVAMMREAEATVAAELAAHGGGLELLPRLTALSKCDLVDPATHPALAVAWRQAAPDGGSPWLISAAASIGLDELTAAIAAAVGDGASDRAVGPPEFEVEHATYRPAADQGFEVVREQETGSYRVVGRGIEVLVRRHDLTNPEAVEYLERRLREIGVLKALVDAGFAPGDEVRIGEESFDLWP